MIPARLEGDPASSSFLFAARYCPSPSGDWIVCKKTGTLFTRRLCPLSVTDHVGDNSLNDVVSGSDCATRAVAFFAVVLFDFYSDVPA